MTTPLWVSFSFRFAREQMERAGWMERAALAAVWASAGILLIGNLSHPALVYGSPKGDGTHFFLAPPFGNATVLHVMAGLALVLWNLHATLGAARASGCRRVSLAIYSLVPMFVTAFYLFAELLLYGQLSASKALLVLAASVVSLAAFAVALRLPSLASGRLDSSQPIVYAPTIPIALGFCLVALVIIAEVVRGIGMEGASGWQEGFSVIVLAMVFVLWVFSGLREEIRRLADRGFYAARSDYREAWERVEHVFRISDSPAALLAGLAGALRAALGPLHVVIWLEDEASGDLVPVAETQIPRLAAEHPLCLALHGRTRALVLSGDAAKVDEVPLHLACEVLRQRYGLRVFCPIPAGDRLVGILGCGPAGGRTFHPEDLELLRMIGARIGERPLRTGTGPETPDGGGLPLPGESRARRSESDAASTRTVHPGI